MKRLTLVNVSEGFEKGLMPLGLCYLASYLKKYGDNVKIRILDSNTEDIYQNLKSTDVVGITSVTSDLNRAKKFGKFVKERYDVPVIIGGVHISTLPKLSEPFDVGVIGEGEQTLLERMEISEFSPKFLKKIRGICYEKNEVTKPRELIEPLDIIPMPDRSLLNVDHYLKRKKVIPYYYGRTLSILTSRGCPFKCTFCSTSRFWKKYRAFSAEYVVEEIKHLINTYKIEILHIFDDLFTADAKRFEKIVKLMEKEGINQKIKIMCLTKADLLNDKIMGMLKKINVVIIGVGLESGCNKTLQYLKKGTVTVQNNINAVELCTKHKIPLMASFMVGSPYENAQDMKETLRFIRKYRSNPYFIPLPYVSTPFPGTEFWDYAERKGIPLDDYDSYCMDIPNNIEILEKAPVLTDIPIQQFFTILNEFRKEASMSGVKGEILLRHLHRLLIEIARSAVGGRNPHILNPALIFRLLSNARPMHGMYGGANTF